MAQHSKKDGILLHSGTNEVEFMEFYLAGKSYGVNVSKVVRVVSLRETQITKVTDSNPAVMGVIYDQGHPVMLIDLKRALAISQAGSAAEDRQLVLIARFNQKVSGYLIDGIQKIHRSSWDKFQPMSSGLGDSGYITGTINLEERIVLILDLERLMLDFTPPKPADEAKLKGAPSVQEQRGRVHIVYAEDSSMVRKITAELLRKAGYSQITSFENGQLALDYLLAQRDEAVRAGQGLKDRVGLILTDIEMPKLDGLTLCKQIKSQSGGGDQVPAVVVYSSLINEEMIRKCKSVGTDRELSKPTGEDLVKAVDELVGIVS